MSAAADVRKHAQMFGWEVSTDRSRLQDTFVRGKNMVTASYRRGDQAVMDGRLYEFASIKDVHLREVAQTHNRKDTVVDWLVRLGS